MKYLFQKLAYADGSAVARAKLGTAAGPIGYAPRSGEQDTLADRLSQSVWLEADTTPHVNGEESSLSLPNNEKIGSMSDGAYGSSDGTYATGSMDVMQGSPVRNEYLTSAINQAFIANEDMDRSYGPESAMTQPHGSMKAAASMGGMGSLGGAGPASTMGMGGGLKGMGGVRSAKGMMGLNSVPKPPVSAAGQSLKNPMQGNMQQQLGAGAIAADAANSFGFNHRRILGNPL